MSEQTINRLLDLVETYGTPLLTAYFVVGVIFFVVFFAVFISIFVIILRKMKKMDDRFDHFYRNGRGK